ncbi:MAG TPA: hypothetical protein VFJ96_08685 [Gemmatimonadaceae bacterium]|nr:hypothetical protein [Gemmatimonadaceae bacterium]
MKITMQVEPAGGELVPVEYRWDVDTAILIATFREPNNGANGVSGSIELAGKDGSWLILDLQGGSLGGVEVAVWPDVKHVTSLAPPSGVESVRMVVATTREKPGVTLLQMDTTLIAESDQEEHVIHFRIGSTPAARTVRIARDVLVDLSEQQTLRGIWMLNVPRFPD